MKPIRFEAGRRLSKSEKDEVLKSLGDSYKDHNAPKVLKRVDRISGDPIYGYEYNPDLMYRSDITGRLIRHYVTLPDGRKAHPTELFPNVTKAEIDKYAMEREHAESLKRSRDKSRENRIAAPGEEAGQSLRAVANEKYKATGRKIEGSYFAQDSAGRLVRVDAKDAGDIAYYEAQGFKQITPVVNMAKRKNPTAADSAKWEKLWGNYIAALKALDKPIKGANARMAQARLGKAEKAIAKFDPDAWEKFVAGRKNPGGVHLPGLPAKAQREYEDILKESKAAGRYKGREKEVAARTVRKQYGANPDYTYWNVYHVDSKKSPPYDKTFLGASPFGMSKPDAIERFKRSHYPGRMKAGTKLVAEKAVIKNPTKRIKVKNAYVDLVIKGQAKKTPKGWQVSRKTYEQGRGTVKVASGYYLDRSTGLVYAKRERNMATKTAKKKMVKRCNWYGEKKRKAARRATKRRNISEGFYDDTGFHPIRSAADYDSTSAGETGRKPRRARSKKKVRAKRKAVKTARTKRRVPARKATTRKTVKRPVKKATTKRRNALTRAKMPAWIKKVITRARREGADSAVNWEFRHASKAERDAFDSYLVKVGHPSAYEGGTQEYRVKRFVRERTTKRRNPTYKMYVKDRFGPGQVYYGEVVAATATAAKRALFKQLKSEYLYSKGEPRHKLSHIAAKAANPRNASRKAGAPAGTSRWVVEQAKKLKAREIKVNSSRNPKIKITVKTKNKARRNPDAASIRKTFAGRVNKNSTLYFPDGTPSGLAKLGKLVKIKTRRGTIKLTRNPGEVWLCCDERGKFHLGSTTKAPLYAGNPGDLGQVEMIEYQESKPHLGYGKTIWFHKLGEEGGTKPTLHANGKGELKFKGGSYRITSRGIEN